MNELVSCILLQQTVWQWHESTAIFCGKDVSFHHREIWRNWSNCARAESTVVAGKYADFHFSFLLLTIQILPSPRIAHYGNLIHLDFSISWCFSGWFLLANETLFTFGLRNCVNESDTIKTLLLHSSGCHCTSLAFASGYKFNILFLSCWISQHGLGHYHLFIALIHSELKCWKVVS